MVIINSFKYPESTIRQEQKNVRAVLDKRDLGLGTLYISDSTLAWQLRDDIGFTVSYFDISLHAVSRDVNLHPKDCLYVMLDSHISLMGNVEEVNDDDSDCSEADVSELIFEPENPLVLPNLYECIKICQELNPDPNDVEDEDDDNLYVDAEDEMENFENQRNGGDSEINELSRRLQGNYVDIQYMNNGNNEEEFEDAD